MSLTCTCARTCSRSDYSNRKGRSSRYRPPVTSSARTWRARTGSIVAAALLVVGVAGGIGLDSALVQGNGFLDLVILLTIAAGLVWRFAYHPRISITGDDLVVRNPLRTRRIPVAEVTDVQPGYSGLQFSQLSGPNVVGWAVQKTNVAQWLRRETRADRIAAEVRMHLPNAMPPASAPR